jgi:UDPglucose 6-dehydrogenase
MAQFPGAAMKVCVFGLWHLGSVTAACLASVGHHVVGLDRDANTIQGLAAGKAPLHEPGLDDLLALGLSRKQLEFTTDPAAACAGAEVLWITHDTPVDDEDRADPVFVRQQVIELFPHLAKETIVLISSQLPVGTTRALEWEFASLYPDRQVHFAYAPENLRLGQAIRTFMESDRVVVGIRHEEDRARLGTLLAPIARRVEWMAVESAEMVKHALNAFLATSVTFINEIASLCEKLGGDAKEVERGLKSDTRIGPTAYLSPGSAFGGGTLARDISFLIGLGETQGQPVYLLRAVKASNESHASWVKARLSERHTSLAGRVVAIWGLTYKPGTDTLRRSPSVELCRWLSERGARVQAHDPVVRRLPEHVGRGVDLCASSTAALDGAETLVVATAWPDYREVAAGVLKERMTQAFVIDANRFLEETLGRDPQIGYVAIGRINTT